MLYSLQDNSPAGNGGEIHISRINTCWSNIADAHREEWSRVADAQRMLIERYSGAVYRYLLTALRNQDAADEVFQQFAMRVIQGGFRHARQDRGRFRDYLKGAIRRLIATYFRRKGRDPLNGMRDLDLGDDATPVDSGGENLEQSLNRSCREELLARAWEALRLDSLREDNFYYDILQLRTRHPHLPSQELASELAASVGLNKPLSASAARKTLQRSRMRFSELLLTEVAAMCGSLELDEIEAELLNLELHAYCRSSIRRRREDRKSLLD